MVVIMSRTGANKSRKTDHYQEWKDKFLMPLRSLIKPWLMPLTTCALRGAHALLIWKLLILTKSMTRLYIINTAGPKQVCVLRQRKLLEQDMKKSIISQVPVQALLLILIIALLIHLLPLPPLLEINHKQKPKNQNINL